MKSPFASAILLLATVTPTLSASELERLRALCAEQELQIEQLETRIARLTDTPPPARSSKPAPAAASSAVYTVRPGDSLERIANRSGMSVSALAKLNGLKPNSIIHPGQKITTSAAASNSTPAPIADRPVTSYKIKSGDTLYKVSRKYGVSVSSIKAANPGIDPNSLRVGQTIKISSSLKQSAPEVAKKASTQKNATSFQTSSTSQISNKETKPPVTRRASNEPIKINTEITYDEFARNYNTTTNRLDELNGLQLDPNTVLAKGSELYIPN